MSCLKAKSFDKFCCKDEFGDLSNDLRKRNVKLVVITQGSKVGTYSICPVPTFGSRMQRGHDCRPKHDFDCKNMTFRSWLDYKSSSWGLYGQKSFFSSEVILEQNIIILLLTSAGEEHHEISPKPTPLNDIGKVVKIIKGIVNIKVDSVY